ncbi:MAG: RNA polymerase sporulation sigma factor SigE [Bacillota bacterium]|jgi:RNA polymerase sporulation-specific sigma factor
MTRWMLHWKLRSRILFYRWLALLGVDIEQRALHFVGSSEALPPPLSEDEEAYLLSQLKTGDSAVKSVLIERNLRLVVYIARKFENTGIPIEDLSSIGSIGLIKAVGTFNPDRNIKLATYASRCIENEILMFLRRNNRQRYEISLDEPLNVDWDGNELLLSDVIPHDGAEVHRELEAQVDREMLNNALSRLPERERTIMELRFGLRGGEEHTQKEVADHLGISQSYISRLEKRIIKRLRREFKKME